MEVWALTVCLDLVSCPNQILSLLLLMRWLVGELDSLKERSQMANVRMLHDGVMLVRAAPCAGIGWHLG